jgi:hypothetical protein
MKNDECSATGNFFDAVYTGIIGKIFKRVKLGLGLLRFIHRHSY